MGLSSFLSVLVLKQLCNFGCLSSVLWNGMFCCWEVWVILWSSLWVVCLLNCFVSVSMICFDRISLFSRLRLVCMCFLCILSFLVSIVFMWVSKVLVQMNSFGNVVYLMCQVVLLCLCNWNVVLVSVIICVCISCDSVLIRLIDDGFCLCGMVLLFICFGWLFLCILLILLCCRWQILFVIWFSVIDIWISNLVIFSIWFWVLC